MQSPRKWPMLNAIGRARHEMRLMEEFLTRLIIYAGKIDVHVA